MIPTDGSGSTPMIQESCIFCSPGPGEIVLENELAYGRYDKNPVSPGHLLIIPKRHITSIFEATPTELADLWDLLKAARMFLEQEYTPNGYNIGINEGEAAGQTIPHLHIHLIPRYDGDMADPRGGVRGVIPQKQHYQVSE